MTSWPSTIAKCHCQRFVLWLVYLLAEWKLTIMWASAKNHFPKWSVLASELPMEMKLQIVLTGLPWSEILLTFSFIADLPNSQMIIFTCKIILQFQALVTVLIKIDQTCLWMRFINFWRSVRCYIAKQEKYFQAIYELAEVFKGKLIDVASLLSWHFFLLK